MKSWSSINFSGRMSWSKFGHDRFTSFDVYWIQTNRQTDKLNCIYIYIAVSKYILLFDYFLLYREVKGNPWLCLIKVKLFTILSIYKMKMWFYQFIRWKCVQNFSKWCDILLNWRNHGFLMLNSKIIIKKVYF